MLNRDFKEIISSFNAERVEYLVIGAYAVAAHGLPRATGDLDLWVHRTPANAERVWRALARFGAPLDRLTKADLLTPDVFIQIGVAPGRVDLFTDIAGVSFDEAYPARITVTMAGVDVPALGLDHLLRSKRAAGRPQDLADVARLEARTK